MERWKRAAAIGVKWSDPYGLTNYPCQKAETSDSTNRIATVKLKMRRRFGSSSQRLTPQPKRIHTEQRDTHHHQCREQHIGALMT